MLQQILTDLYIDPELLAELDEEQKQVLFCKMRQEQIRRWKERELKLEAEEKRKNLRNEERSHKVRFLNGADGQPWVWVMGDHKSDKTIEQILEDEAKERAREQAEQEAEILRKQQEEALQRLIEEAQPEISKAEPVSKLKELPTKPDPAQTVVNKTTQNQSTAASATDASTTQGRYVKANVVQMRKEFPPQRAQGDLDKLKEKRSSEIFEKMLMERQKSIEEAEVEVKQLVAAWHEQEKKAKEAEEVKRFIAKRVREDNAKAMRRLKTESQVIGTLMMAYHDAVSKNSGSGSGASSEKPVPGTAVCPRGRPPKPPDREAVISWYKDVEEPRGIGIDKATKRQVDYFYGLISRQEAEECLADSPPGTFLIRLSDRVWGYALSYRSGTEGCKHYLIDASDGRYRFFGNNQLVHSSLHEMVEYHKHSPFSLIAQEVFVSPPKSSVALSRRMDMTALRTDGSPPSPDVEITHM